MVDGFFVECSVYGMLVDWFYLCFRVLPLKKAAEEKTQAMRAAAAASFKSMLKERGDIFFNSRWSRVCVCCKLVLTFFFFCLDAGFETHSSATR